jgi:aminoglycoside 6-adenylyltransferase
VLPDEDAVLGKLLEWCGAEARIRAVILTSSRATPDRRADLLSDYDVILAVQDPAAFAGEDGWVSQYGAPAARWGDESELLGLPTSFRGVVYADGVKIDYTIWPEEMLQRASAADALPEGLDVGYRVLLDKDGRTDGWLPPTYRAHIPAPPTEAAYRAQVEEFWWSATYVAKALWRGEVVFAKFVLDQDMRLGPLRRVLEWRIELDHDWSLRPGAYGRGLERLLPPDLAAELAATYVGAGVEENWDALFATAALFRRVATEVGAALGHGYPLEDVDEVVTAHLEAVRVLPR